MKNHPSTRQMQYLLALSESMNFRVAAEKCNITQPTLSAAIQEIESLLGLRILDRSRRKKMVFTPFGLEVLETAKKVLTPLSQLSDKAQSMSKPLSGPLRIGLIPTMAPYLLPQILPKLQKSFPKMDFQITEGMSAVLLDKLNTGQIDIALMAFPFDTPNLNQKVFFEEAFYCAAPKHVFKTNQKLSLKDLENHKLLLLEDGHCLREHALSACKIQNTEDKKTFSATSLLTICQMVAQGYGITLLPEMVIKNGVLPKNVSLHSFKKPMPTRTIGASWRSHDPQEANIQAIFKKLSEIWS